MIPSHTDAQAARRSVQKARRRSTLTLIAVFWVFVFAVLTIRASFGDSAPFAVLAPRRAAIALFGAGLCFAMVFALGRLRRRSFAERIALGVVGAFAMACLLAVFGFSLNRLILPIPGLTATWADLGQWVIVWLGYCLAWTGTHLALTYHWEADEEQRTSAAMKELAQEARIAALRYQINPHFLFNTLNTISSLVLEGRNREAETMLLTLSSFLRSTLSLDPRAMIPLGEEIAFQQLYLAIEESRFAERMRIRIDVPEALRGSAVPALILQPLVENAIRHGVGASEQVTTVTIAAVAKGSELRLVVEDDADGTAKGIPGSGVGLANVRDRLLSHFGAGGQLLAGRVPAKGFRAEIRMPLSAAA